MQRPVAWGARTAAWLHALIRCLHGSRPQVALNRMGVHLGNPKEMISKADAYAVELKPGTMLGGTVTVG